LPPTEGFEPVVVPEDCSHKIRSSLENGGLVTTPAGSFEHTMRVQISGGAESLCALFTDTGTDPLSKMRTFVEYFAAGVGLVRLDFNDTVKGPTTAWELVRYQR
jgi:hypothetical protein